MLRIDIHKKSQKFLDKLPAKQKKQIDSKIYEIQKNGTSFDSVHLKGSDYYRAAVGEYRIIYEIYDVEDEKVLAIILIGNRNDDDIYKKFKRLLSWMLFAP